MHMGIGLKKYVVAWFGPTCAHEIDLYGRGEKVLSTLPCSPCWKRGCDVFEPCNQKIDLEAMEKALDRGLHKLIGSSAKPQNELGELIFSEAQ
jgi:heptosyltransferase-2